MNKFLSYIFFSITTLIFFHSFVPAQNKNPKYVFPEADSEFTVEFPQKPQSETITSQGNIIFHKASVDISLTRISAYYANFSEEIITKVKNSSDEKLKQDALPRAEAMNLLNPKFSVGTNALGKYVKLTGLQIFKKRNYNFESYTYYGQKSMIILDIAIPIKSYPSSSATNFLNTLKKRDTEQKPLKPYLLDLNEFRGLKPINQGFIFPEDSLEFTVNFPQKPTFEEVRTQDKGVFKVALLRLNDCFLRVEYGLLSQLESKSFREELDDNALSQDAFNTANLWGFNNTTVVVGKNQFGRFTKMRGYKMIQGMNFIYDTHSYFGQKYFFLITVGAPVEDFPTVNITKFLDSLKRVN